MDWFTALKTKYQAGVAHCFLLHGAIDDYVAPGVTLPEFLTQTLSKHDLQICYNVSEGITFPLPSLRAKFCRALGLTAALGDPIVAALRGASGQTTPDDIVLPREPEKALPLLERALLLGRAAALSGEAFDLARPDEETEERETTAERPSLRCALILTFAEALFPPGEMTFLSPVDRSHLVCVQRWAASKAIAEAGGIVIMTTRDLAQIHPDVRAAASKIAAVPVPLPGLLDRQRYIHALTEDPERPLLLADACSTRTLAITTAGLSLYQIEDVKLRAEAVGVPVDLPLVKERKNEVLRQEYQEVLEILESEGGFETIGGYEYVKQAFTRLVARIRRGAVTKLPKGILLLGPAGTGKTELAKALAKEAGVTCVRFNVGRTLGKYVGESEAKLERALLGLIALAPCIAFIDELDQQTGRGETDDNKVEKRIFARLLEVMSDPQLRGKVVWIAASNRPDLIDPAVKRSGRLDYKIPVLPPEPDERLAILQTQLRRYEVTTIDLGQLDASTRGELLRHTEGWTGAELEKVVLKALDLAEDNGEDRAVTIADMREALALLRPSTKNIELMTKLALAEVDDLTLVPARYRSLFNDRAAAVDRPAEEVVQTRGPRSL